MRNTIIIIALLTGLLLSSHAFGQTTGCCCDTVSQSASFTTKADCDARGHYFAGTPPDRTTTCDQYCQTQQPTIVCGDNQCQNPETPQTCPQDCAPQQCGSPTYAPTPQLTANPAPGKKAITLRINTPCPAHHYRISRCEGTNCAAQTPIAETTSPTFTDHNPSLKFNQDYTYTATAFYTASGQSAPGTTTANPGDLECWQQQGTFCLGAHSYDQHRDYLTTHGYGPYSATSFTTAFEDTTQLAFSGKFKQAWTCQDNQLQQAGLQCSANEYCVADEQGARCVQPQTCTTGFDPFGLYATPDTCEANRYCYYDKSTTNTNACHACQPHMSCIDYKSENACARDNCNAGACQWRPIIDELGIGTCIDAQQNNCPFCTTKGTTGLPSTATTSTIWEQCTQEKSNALSTTRYPCLFDKDFKRSKTCDEVSCADYTQSQCSAPSAGITLNQDNTLATTSNDPCGIRVCEYDTTTGCVKNADGTGGRDCRPGDKQCELDYQPPTTTFTPYGTADRVDALNIHVFDKTNLTSPTRDHAGTQGYITRLCIGTCTNPRAFPITVTTTRLILKNGKLNNGRQTIADLAIGENTIHYYSTDPAGNVEIVKRHTVTACSSCNGPALLELTVTGGQTTGTTIQTTDTTPTLTLAFDEPVLLDEVILTTPGDTIRLPQLTQGLTDTHELTTPRSLTGTYQLLINAHNQNNIAMPAPGLQYTLTIDPTLAGATITPADGSTLTTTSTPVTITLNRAATLTSVTHLHEQFTDYAKTSTTNNITSQLTQDNNTYTTTLSQLQGGKHTIIVNARGHNTLPLYREASFFVATQPPRIRLTSPSFGITPTTRFNTTLETELPAECAYVYNTPSPPSQDDFELFSAFQSLGTVHTATNFTIGNNTAPLHAYCSFEEHDIIQHTYDLSLDPTPPRILNAFTQPDTIAEQYIPGQDLYVTTLNVELDKPGFCKYSPNTPTFSRMERTFPGYDTTPKKSLTATINVTTPQTHTLYVSCKGTNELTTPPETVRFTIDLSQDLHVSRSTPTGVSTLNFTLGIVANKRVFCYYGEQADDTTTCMEPCKANYVQAQTLTVTSTGTHTYYAQCTTPTGQQAPVLELPVIVDTSPPQILSVNDASTLAEDPDTSWHNNQIRLAVNATDPESGISHYLITLKEQETNRIIFENYASNDTSGAPITITTTNGAALQLENGTRYHFTVQAVNNVGLTSETRESDGVRIDTSQVPAPCFDGIHNQNETDIDCGGECAACLEGMQCLADSDCASNWCVNNTCQPASCEDNTKNGLETDVDCGGNCPACQNGQTCTANADCTSNYCDPRTKTCADAPACADGTLSPGEADVDCGSICDTKCGEGQNCQTTDDCQNGLACDPAAKTCLATTITDADNDGVSNDQDTCPNTPPGEEANEEGCGPSQTYTLGDTIHDKWRLDYFGCITCLEAAATADPDEDGLTNEQEFAANTNPTAEDTDGDGADDSNELEKGTNPNDPDDTPTSLFLSILKTLLWLAILGGATYWGYNAYQKWKAKPAPAAKPTAPRASTEVPTTKKDQLAELRGFAKEEELPKEEWIPVEKKIKKKAFAPEKFKKALEKLEALADKPAVKVHSALEDLGEKEKEQLKEKYKQLESGQLSAKEKETLFKKLKITAEEYKKHEKEVSKELRK